MRNFFMLCLLAVVTVVVVGCGPERPDGYGPFKMNGQDFYLVRLDQAQSSWDLRNSAASAAELKQFGQSVHCPKFADSSVCTEVQDEVVKSYGPVTGAYTRTLTRKLWRLSNHQVKYVTLVGDADSVGVQPSNAWCLMKIDTTEFYGSPVVPVAVKYTIRHDTALVRVRPDSVISQRRARIADGHRLEYTLTQNLGQWKNGARVDTLVGYDQIHSGGWTWKLPLLDMRDFHEGPWQYARSRRVRGGEYTIRTDVPRTDGSLYRVILPPNREVADLPDSNVVVHVYVDARPHHSWVKMYGTFTQLNEAEPSYVLEGYDIHLAGDEGWKR